MNNHHAKSLLSHKAYLEIVFDALPALVYCKDTEGRIVCVNDAYAVKFNMAKVDFEGKTVEDLFPKSAGHLMANDADVIKTGAPQKNMFLSYETSSGEAWVQACKLPFRDKDGEIIGVIGFAIDIPDLGQIQDELKNRKEGFRSFFKTARDCIYITSLDGKILEINDAAIEIFGYESKEALMAVPVKDLYSNPEDRDRLRQKIARDGMVNKFPIDMRRKDGQVIHAVITAMPIKDNSGEIYGYHGTAHDITELKKAEERKLLLEAELRQAQKMEAVAKLSGGIAHDFNNLLFTIMGSIELAKSFADAGQAKQLDRAYRASLEAKQLIRRFLELSERAPAKKSQGSLGELVQRAVSSRIAESKAIHYEIQISEQLYEVAFVYDQLLQVMENLLSNAENALPDGGTITVAAKNMDLERGMASQRKLLAPGKYIKISVSDNGIGIPEEKIEKIFDPYFSTHSNPSSKGHGLGLTTVYAAVKRHKGGITVDSKPGEGTTVVLYLPAI